MQQPPQPPQGRDRASWDALYRQNHILQLSLRDKEADLQKQKDLVQSLERENRRLAKAAEQNVENETKIRELKKTNKGLKAENSSLSARVHDLTHKVRELTRQLQATVVGGRAYSPSVRELEEDVAEWRRTCENQENRISRMRENLDDYIRARDELSTENARLREANRLLQRSVDLHERIQRR